MFSLSKNIAHAKGSYPLWLSRKETKIGKKMIRSSSFKENLQNNIVVKSHNCHKVFKDESG